MHKAIVYIIGAIIANIAAAVIGWFYWKTTSESMPLLVYLGIIAVVIGFAWYQNMVRVVFFENDEE